MKRDTRQPKPIDNPLKSQYVMSVCVAIISLLLLMPSHGTAADPSAGYPSRPIDFVAPSAPGSPFDVLNRLISSIIAKEKLLSQPLVVLNKPGSGAAVGMAYVIERKGNPHLLLAMATTTLLCTPLTEKLPYNYKSFVPISNLVSEGSVLSVRSDSPYKTIDDLIAEARKRPNQLNQGGASFISAESLMGKSMQKAKGVKWNFISFAGSEPEALVNLLGGNVDFIITTVLGIADHVTTGKLRVLLAASDTRYPEFPDVPTFKEAGFGEPFMTYRGILGPPNMPDYAVKKIEPVFRKVMETDQFKKYMRDRIMNPAYMPTNEYGKFLDKMNDRWKEALTEIGLLKK